MNLNFLLGLIPSCVGFLLLALGAFFYFRTKSFSERAQQAKGTVTELVFDSDSEGSGYYTVFEYTALTGKTLQITSNLRTNPPSHKVGEVIDILYDPSKPHDARIKKSSTLYFVPILLGGMGFVFLCAGIVMVIVFAMFNI